MAFPGFRSQSEPVKHVISLGCRCSQASVYRALGQRRYALPFDWIFTSPQMVTHCLQDDFQSFLDRQQLYQNGSSFDAIGLKPGSAPRERRLIGHKLYSTLTAGVGKGTIFNHRDPLHNDEDYLYTVRCVERFRLALASGERKLFVMLNLNRQLWLEPDILQLFTELQRRSRNFLLLVVDCSCKNLGAAAGHVELLSELGEEQKLLMYRVPCCGDNTGSYFRNDWDAERVKSLLVDPFTFHLSPDPLEVQQVQQVQLGERGGYGADCQVDDAKESTEPKGTVVRRWGRKT
ncbi:unnamed protein product [Cladocopium goreaui]|uniref:Uncharacterized protein n=1 Tax=Cladocopium goreaui TaxID=2562237 RepID=A0A9P1D7K8_9DINO|nr:unnamed protein product [Cladocopium goreaui]|mmetsp:Transcript_11193/g.24677  ORF Transcript_11193/g.24677 Transcript_11193/m.24677 type:complete len:290 (-) Transcript_11193:44-913(-)